jgi:hypothetical protein
MRNKIKKVVDGRSLPFEGFFLFYQRDDFFDKSLKFSLGKSSISIEVKVFENFIDLIVRWFFNIKSIGKSFEQNCQLMPFYKPRFVGIEVLESLLKLSSCYLCVFVETVHKLIQ